MKIVCVLGSPRLDGNSAVIAKRFCNAVKNRGADVQTFALNKLKFRGCQGCMLCKTKLDKCALDDNLTEVLDSIRDCDILVMASPTYFGEVSSQLKGFIDRTYSYLVPDYRTNPEQSRLPPGKKMMFIQTQGKSDESYFNDVFPRYDHFFQWLGFKNNYLIRACGVLDKGAVENREDVMKLADDTAKKVMAGKR